MRKKILGTSDTRSMRQSSHQPTTQHNILKIVGFQVWNYVHLKIPQTQNKYLLFWFSFLLLSKSTKKSKKLGTYQPSRQISRPQTTIFCGNIYKLLVAKFVTASQETEIPSPQMALNFLYLVECTAVIEPRFSLFVFANSLPDFARLS